PDLGAVPPLGCNGKSLSQTWNRAFIDNNGDGVPDGQDLYFPAVALDFNYGDSKMLQITVEIRNSDWVLTNAARGNNDIEFCAVTKHQDATKNGPPPPDGQGVPFVGKYGDAKWDPTTGMFSGVLTTVSNPSKVKTNGTGSPAVCGRGGFTDISGVTWRTW